MNLKLNKPTTGALCALLLLVTSCSPETTAFVSGGGVTGTGKSEGTITALQTVTVNTIEWDTTNAVVMIDEQPATVADLSLGQRAIVAGTADGLTRTGTADEITVDAAIEGAIESATTDPEAGTTTAMILGQEIEIVDAYTVFAGTTFAQLAVDDRLRVYGSTSPSGHVRATRVEHVGLAGAGPHAVTRSGVVTALDDTAGTLLLDGIAVSFDPSTTTIDLGGAPLANGARIEVEGSYDGSVILASEIDLADGIADADLGFVSYEGEISNFSPANPNFKVGRRNVSAIVSSVFPNNIGLIDNGLSLRLEGILAGGTLIAATTESLAAEAIVEAELPVGFAMDPVAGTVELLGITIRIDTATIFADNDVELQLPNLAAGDFLRVRGIWDPASGTVYAHRVERDSTPGDVRLQGPLTAIDATTASLLGVQIPIASSTQFVNLANQNVPAAAFQGENSIGSNVRIHDDADGDATTIDVADEVHAINLVP